MKIKKSKLFAYVLKNAQANITARDEIDAYDVKALKFIDKNLKEMGER